MHMGYTKTYAMIKTKFYWCGMSRNVLEWCKCCNWCVLSSFGKDGGGGGNGTIVGQGQQLWLDLGCGMEVMVGSD